MSQKKRFTPAWVGQHHIRCPALSLEAHCQVRHLFAAMDPLVYLQAVRMNSFAFPEIVVVTQYLNSGVGRSLTAADRLQFMTPIAEGRSQVAKLTREVLMH